MFRGNVGSIATYLGVVCLLSISFLVFVNASISFVITNILESSKNVGNDVGTLGFVDELIAMVACPLWGVVSDRIGSRSVVTISYTIIGLSLFCFVNTANIYPQLLLVRVVFSIGAAGASTMVTAILPSLTSSFTRNHAQTTPDDNEVDSLVSCEPDSASQGQDANLSPPSRISTKDPGSFRLAGFVGTAAGCGALLAVFGFLRVPPYLEGRHFAADRALRETYYFVGIIAFLAAAVAFAGLRIASNGQRSSEGSSVKPHWGLPLSAIKIAFANQDIGLAYLGGFVARASSVGISLFIPLWINSFYTKSGRCRIEDPADAKTECRDAYILSSIITGVSQLAALFCAPIFGFVSEKLQQQRLPLITAAAAGFVSYTVLGFVEDPRINDGTVGPFIILLAILTGISQVGAIVCSLGLLGYAIAQDDAHHRNPGLTAPDQSRGAVRGQSDTSASEGPELLASEAQSLLSDRRPVSPSKDFSRTNTGELEKIKGSIAGIYSFCGGVAILILTKLGGSLFDSSPSAPFWLLAGFNALLCIGAGASAILSAIRQTRVS